MKNKLPIMLYNYRPYSTNRLEVRRIIPLYAHVNHTDIIPTQQDPDFVSSPHALEILTNPLHAFIFLSVFSIWFGSFSRRKLESILTNKMDNNT